MGKTRRWFGWPDWLPVKKGRPMRYGIVRWQRVTEQRLRGLCYPNYVVADVVRLVEMHLRFHTSRWVE